jgi:hypothetical protein
VVALTVDSDFDVRPTQLQAGRLRKQELERFFPHRCALREKYFRNRGQAPPHSSGANLLHAHLIAAAGLSPSNLIAIDLNPVKAKTGHMLITAALHQHMQPRCLAASRQQPAARRPFPTSFS